MRARLDRDGLVDDVALDPRGGGQADLEAPHAAHDAAVDHDVIGDDLALDRGRLADGQQMRADVALDRALDLDVAGGLEVAGHMQIRRQSRCGRLRLGRGGFEVGFVIRRCGARALRGRRGLRLVSLRCRFVDLALRKHRSQP